MRIDRINLSVDTDGKTGKVRSASIYFENVSDLGERVSGQFAITLEEYERIQREEILPETIAEQKLVEILQVKPEDDATAAFVKLSEDFESLVATTGEMKEQAIQVASMAAIEKVDTLLPALRKLVRIDELTPDDVADLIALYESWEPGQAVGVGDIRSYDGKLYKVVQAHTTQADWTPDATPALWTEIAPPETEDGEEIVPDFVQPTGAHDAYKTGDKVLFEGKIYESTINANTWSPTEYPQGWKEVTD